MGGFADLPGHAMLVCTMKLEHTHAASVWIPVRAPEPGLGPVWRHPNVVALAMIATAATLMLWGADLFYGRAIGGGPAGGHLVSGMESFAVFAAVPGQVLASLLMWLAVRSYVRNPPRVWLVVLLLVVGHVAGIGMSALFASGMLWFGPLLWASLTPGMVLILLSPAVALGIYFRLASTPRLLSLLAVAFLTVAIGMFAWSVVGCLGGVDPTTL